MSVDYSGDKVIVTTKDNSTYTANKIIVTVPVAVLQSKDIKFTPDLSGDKLTSIGNLGAGVMDKLVLEFDSVFWDPNLDWLNYISDGDSIWI